MRLALSCLGALVLAGCGGDGGDDEFASRCMEGFNASAENREWVAKSGKDPSYGPKAGEDFRAPVWFGPSRRDPEKCLAVVGLGGNDFMVLLRENLRPGAEKGAWIPVPSDRTEGTPDELTERLESADWIGAEDGTVERK